MTTGRRFSGELSMGTRRVSQTAMQIKSAVWRSIPGIPTKCTRWLGKATEARLRTEKRTSTR